MEEKEWEEHKGSVGRQFSACYYYWVRFLSFSSSHLTHLQESHKWTMGDRKTVMRFPLEPIRKKQSAISPVSDDESDEKMHVHQGVRNV